MKLAVSNIAWTNDEEPAVAQKLQELGVKFVEVAPTKKWSDPTAVELSEAEAYKNFWQSYGIEIVAFQSMLFNQPELKLIQNDDDRQQALGYLQKFIKLASIMGAQRMVFGSPKNRQRNDLSYQQALDVMTPFFKQIGDAASDDDVTFCIEPNAPQYACDFVTTAQEGIDIVKAVSNPGFQLHLDIACMTLSGDDVKRSIVEARQYLKHFHISSPMLGQVEFREDVDHEAAAQALREIGYNGFVSIEMKPGPEGTNLERVGTAVSFAQSVYSS